MANGRNFDPNDAKQIALEIEKIYKRIGLANPFKSGTYSLSELKIGLEEARDMMMDWADGIGEIERGFKAILDEVKATSNSFNSAKRNLTSLSSISSQIRDHQLGINQLSSKQLTQLKSKLDSELKSLSINNEGLKQQQKDLEAKKSRTKLSTQEQQQLNRINILLNNTNALLQDQDSLQKQLNDKLEEEIHSRETIEKKLGVAGGLLRGISKIPILGDLVDTNEALQVAEGTIETTESGVRGLGAAFKNLGKQAMSGLLNTANLLQFAVVELVLALKATDDGAGDMAKKMNLTYTEALRVRGELGTIAGISGDAALNTKNLQESYMAVGQALGSNAMLNQQDLITMTKLTQQAGLTHDELMGIEKLSLVNGKTLEQNTKEILGGAKVYASRNKLILNEKQILREVNNASASLKLTLGGSAEQVAIAAAKTKQFGLNLEQAEKIAQSLLNFESSIEAELSAELLTGKNLNLEKARLLALNGDIAGASAEIANQVGKSSDFAKMNVIQQESLAKAAGMTRDELAQSLMDREALAKLSAVEGASAQEKFNNLVKQVGLEKAKKQLGDEALANQFAQQNTQERFTQSIEKLKELFIQLAEPILQIVSPFADLVSNILPLINVVLQPAIAALRVIGSLISGIVKLITLDFSGAMDTLSPSNLFKGYTDLFSATKNKISPATPVSDFSYSNRTGETTISTKEGGLYSISPNDEIAVAPKINTSLSNKTAPSTSSDLSALVNKIEQMFAKQQDRPVVVHSVVKTENNDVLARGVDSSNRRGFNIQ
jgi:hypothetical protein